MQRNAWHGGALGRLAVTIGLLAVIAAALTACGGSDGGGTDTGTTGEVSTEQSSNSGSDSLVAEAAQVAEQATEELMYAATEPPADPSQLVPYGDWRGPEEAPSHEPGKKVSIVVCAKTAPTCVKAGEAMVEAAESLGWSANIIDGEGTPQGFARAYSTALNGGADAIVGVAVPSGQIGKSLGEAKQQGVITVQAAEPRPSEGPQADAYVPAPMAAMSTLIGWSMIAETDGEANAIVVNDPVFPEIVESSAALETVLESCSGCEATVVEQQFTDALDPTKVTANVRGALSQDPGAEYLYLPYSAPLAATVQAVESAGDADQVAIVTKNADEIELSGVAEGSVAFAVGSSVRWAGWATIDQVVRGLGGEPYLEGTELGIGIAKLDAANVPASGNIDDWPGMIDFQSEYERIWK